jgi:protein-tyrosine phosphatase
MPKLFRVANLGKGFLAVMARPGAHEPVRDTLTGLAALGIGVVVSLLEESEARELGLADEEAACGDAGLDFFSFPIKDRSLPSDAGAVSRLSRWAHTRISNGCGLVFHCRAGIGRSGMMAASVLLHEGFSVSEAFARISDARGMTVPDTPGQLEWVKANYGIIIAKI